MTRKAKRTARRRTDGDKDEAHEILSGMKAKEYRKFAAKHFGPCEVGDLNKGPSNADWLNYIVFVRAAWAMSAMSDKAMVARGRASQMGAEDMMQFAEDFNRTRKKLESAIEFLTAGTLRCMVVAARLDLERKAARAPMSSPLQGSAAGAAK